jgi:hypothetical protein
MRRTLIALSLALLVQAPAGAAEGTAAPAKGTPHAVLIVKLLGLPADSVARGVMLSAFREEMNVPWLHCEKRVGGEWAPGDSIANAFQLMDAAPEDEAWTLDLSVRVPQPVRANVMMQKGTTKEEAQLIRPRMSNISSSRGLVVAATASPPVIHGRRAEFEPVPTVVSLYFADARRIVVPSPNLPGGGYAYPWADAGRVLARAALESLHRTSGAMDAARRADLVPGTRVAESQAEAP